MVIHISSRLPLTVCTQPCTIKRGFHPTECTQRTQSKGRNILSCVRCVCCVRWKPRLIRISEHDMIHFPGSSLTAVKSLTFPRYSPCESPRGLPDTWDLSGPTGKSQYTTSDLGPKCPVGRISLHVISPQD